MRNEAREVLYFLLDQSFESDIYIQKNYYQTNSKQEIYFNQAWKQESTKLKWYRWLCNIFMDEVLKINF